jgi:hypothetical protein
MLSLLLALAPLPACTSSSPASSDGGLDRSPPREASATDAPPVCPSAPPTPASPCALPASVECSFGDPCSFDRYQCENALWVEVIQDGAAPASCPDAAPSTGSTCSACGKSYRCVYEAACTTTTSICAGGHWLTGAAACDAAADATGGPG